MTDERMGDGLWAAVDRLLSSESGIVLRHYATEPTERAALARRIGGICRARDLTFAIAADVELARVLGADLVHNPAEVPTDLPFSRSVHSLEEAEAACAEGAALVFVSPIHSTRSHPGQRPLGSRRALRIARAAGVPAIALGGMDAPKFQPLKRGGFHGWAAIDAWLKKPSRE
jgi:thiamine-phosphate pyrophosphorylase